MITLEMPGCTLPKPGLLYFLTVMITVIFNSLSQILKNLTHQMMVVSYLTLSLVLKMIQRRTIIMTFFKHCVLSLEIGKKNMLEWVSNTSKSLCL